MNLKTNLDKETGRERERETDRQRDIKHRRQWGAVTKHRGGTEKVLL